jgi:tryptophanyl-tRNA synthetase
MADSSKKTFLSGIQPTGRPHIGNYFGAMRQFVELQNSYSGFVMIVDLHALNSVQNKEEMKSNILGVAMDLLAIGLDPAKVILFKQSDVPAHAELTWIFDTITTMPTLMRAHAFKDAEAKNKEISVGKFNYPILMAADMLLYGPDVVPVGQDQKQHIEIAREVARKFNQIYGETFKEPKEMIIESVKIVPGTDGQKMSKSYNNTIPLFATDDEIKKAVMKIPTDSKGIEEPKDLEKDTVFALHKLFTTGAEFDDVKSRYEKGGIGYKESKDILIKNISSFIAPLRDKREALEKNPAEVIALLKEGGMKAGILAEAKMKDVKEKIGVSLY